MGIDTAHYHGWEPRLRSPWFSCLSIVRVALLQVFRRKLYWVVLVTGMFNFLLHWSVIYAVTQFKLDERTQRELLRRFKFDPHAASGQESGYINFMDQQGLVVMLLLAFAGSLLVGGDFRLKSLPFYLSRRIDRRHYIVGKLLAVATIVGLITTVPALALFIEFGVFTSSTDYWIEHADVVGAILSYGLVLSLVLSILLVTLSAHLERTAPIAITWASLFVLLSTISKRLSAATDNDYFRLLDPWWNMREVGKLLFDAFRDSGERSLAYSALWVLAAVCTASLVALTRRVRAVEIV